RAIEDAVRQEVRRIARLHQQRPIQEGVDFVLEHEDAAGQPDQREPDAEVQADPTMHPDPGPALRHAEIMVERTMATRAMKCGSYVSLGPISPALRRAYVRS